MTEIFSDAHILKCLKFFCILLMAIIDESFGKIFNDNIKIRLKFTKKDGIRDHEECTIIGTFIKLQAFPKHQI